MWPRTVDRARSELAQAVFSAAPDHSSRVAVADSSMYEITKSGPMRFRSLCQLLPLVHSPLPGIERAHRRNACRLASGLERAAAVRVCVQDGIV